MCSSRILSRLRLGPAGGKAKKRPIKDTLQEAAMALKKIGRHKLEDRNLLITAELLAARIKEVARLVDSWSRYQVSTARLIDLIEGIHQIQQIEQLPALINIIPNCNMSPSARESFLNIIGKVSRYREAARFLYRTAKRFPLAQKMRTIPVRLSREAFSTPSTDKYTPDLLSKIIKASPKDRQQKLLKEICRVLDLSEQKATDQFSQQVKKTLNEAKIHAEVQIIAYCELRSPKLLPRVICSSKDACFLCNLLIRVYGKIHIPRSHGRLYPGWRLPRVPQLGELERRFCQSLEENFRESCTALLSTGRRTLYPCPNESTFFTLATSGTTVRNTTSSEVSQMAKLKDEKVLVPPKLEPHDVQNTYGIAKPEGNDSLRDLSHKPYLRTQRQRQSIRSRSDLVLLQGSKKYGFLGPKGTSELYFAGPLEIQIECTAESTNLVYYIEWLDNEEATKARGKSSSLPLVDAERLEGEVTLRHDNNIYVTTRDTVLKVSWTNENDQHGEMDMRLTPTSTSHEK